MATSTDATSRTRSTGPGPRRRRPGPTTLVTITVMLAVVAGAAWWRAAVAHPPESISVRRANSPTGRATPPSRTRSVRQRPTATCVQGSAMAQTKDARLEARLTREQDALLRWGASSRGVPVSAFVLDAALERAEQIRALDQVTVLPQDKFEEVTAWLDAPPAQVPEMTRLAEAEAFDNR